MKKSILFLSACLAAVTFSSGAYADSEKVSPIYLNESLIEFENSPIVEAGCTIVPVREFSEKAGFKVIWNGELKSIDIHNEETKVTMYIGDNNIQVFNIFGEDRDVESILAPRIINSVTYIPLRAVSEALGAEVLWNKDTNSVWIYLDNEKDKELLDKIAEDEQEEKEAEDTKNVFYSQYDPEYINLYNQAPYNWTAGRNGYCYVTSYAMLLSNICEEEITPKAVADINYVAGGNPSMCYHGSIVGSYGRRLVSALDEGSQYFKSYDAGRGLTYIDNSTSENVVAALKEALDQNPKGVMVRDLSMPHTMVAIGYEGDTIYFNDPALLEGNVSWDKTCLKNKDISTIAAIIAIK